MKSAEQIEQSIRRLRIEARAGERERTLRDLVATHAQHKREGRRHRAGEVSGESSCRRKANENCRGHSDRSSCCLGTFTLGRSSTAFSQVEEAVNSTLARLKDIVVGIRASKPEPGDSRV